MPRNCSACAPHSDTTSTLEISMDIKRHEPARILANAVEHGNTVYLAGIVADDASADVKGQTQQILKRIDGLLATCGTDKTRLLSAQIWLTDIGNRAAMNEVWTAWVDPQQLPVRACVEAKLADPRLLVEIMVVAAK
jgi:enamine deaminase RidA (YjgF/YER057c/UK114 family)